MMATDKAVRASEELRGPTPSERVTIEAPKVERLSSDRLSEFASELTSKRFRIPQLIMELTARVPYDATHGNIDVFMPGRWDTSSNLIFMDSIVTGASVGEWEGSAAYIMFKPPSPGTYLAVGHFTGYQTTMHLYGPWGTSTAYTAETSDTGAVTAVWDADGPMEFTMNCTAPDNGYGLGYIESIQVFELS